MKRTFCDVCGTEIDDSNSLSTIKETGRKGLLTGEAHVPRASHDPFYRGQRINLEVSFWIDGKANAHDVCKHCILDAVTKLDDRPQEKAAS